MTFEQMAMRFLIALLLGSIIGLERSYIGKEAGVRTSMLVAGGAALFSIIALSLPHVVAEMGSGISVQRVIEGTTFMNVISSIVVGIGFLGGGIIIKTNEHVRGLTTAATIWATSAVGVLAGIGLISFSIFSTVVITVLLYLLRNLNVAELSGNSKKQKRK